VKVPSETPAYFERVVSDPQQWLRVAGALLASAREMGHVISPKDRPPNDLGGGNLAFWLVRPYRLTLAFAVENALKAILAHGGLIYVAKGRIQFPCRPHELLELCGLAGIEVSEQDSLSLQSLSDGAIWAARYPTPLYEDTFEEARGRSMGTLMFPRTFDLCEGIVSTCKELVRSNPRGYLASQSNSPRQ
jgi:hypothetical protein